MYFLSGARLLLLVLLLGETSDIGVPGSCLLEVGDPSA